MKCLGLGPDSAPEDPARAGARGPGVDEGENREGRRYPEAGGSAELTPHDDLMTGNMGL